MWKNKPVPPAGVILDPNNDPHRLSNPANWAIDNDVGTAVR
jgi:hypothetical protein